MSLAPLFSGVYYLSMTNDLFDLIVEKEKRLAELDKMESLGAKEFEEIESIERWLKKQYAAIGDMMDSRTCSRFGVSL